MNEKDYKMKKQIDKNQLKEANKGFRLKGMWIALLIQLIIPIVVIAGVLFLIIKIF